MWWSCAEAFIYATIFKKCGGQTNSGRQERYILTTHFELPYRNVCETVSRCMAIINKVKYVRSKDSVSFVHFNNVNSLYIKRKRPICSISKTGNLHHTANLFEYTFFHLMKYKIAMFMYKVYYEIINLTAPY